MATSLRSKKITAEEVKTDLKLGVGQTMPCTCRGMAPHSWDTPGCYLSKDEIQKEFDAGRIQGVPVQTKIVCDVLTQYSKQQQDAKHKLTNTPLTFDEDVILRCWARCTAKSPNTFMPMMDYGTLDEPMAKLIIKELDLMGYVLTEKPF